MKQKVRLIVSVLLCLLLLTGLAACQPGGDSTKPSPTPTKTGKPSGTTAAPTGTEAPDPPKTLKVGIRQKAGVENYEDNALTKYLEEKLNIKLEFDFFSDKDAITQLSVRMSSPNEKLPDVLFGFSLNLEEVHRFGKEGFLMDLAPYFDNPDWALAKEYEFHENLRRYAGDDIYNRAMYHLRGPNNEQFSWIYSCASVTEQPRVKPFINKKWLEKIGKDIPTSYEELVEVLRLFKTTDCNGNGKQDEIPMVGSVNIGSCDLVTYIMTNWVYLNHNFKMTVNDEGKLTYPYITDEYRQGVRAVRDLVKEELLSNLTWTLKDSSELPPLYTPADETAVCGIFACHPLIHLTKDNPVIFEYEPLPPLKDGYTSLQPLGVGTGCFITTDCRDFDTAARFFMEFSTLETARRSRYGEKGKDWVETTRPDGSSAVKVLNTAAYGGQTRSTWSLSGPAVGYYGPDSPWSAYLEPDPKSWTWKQRQLLDDGAKVVLNHAKKMNPKYMFIGAVYTEKESEALGTLNVEMYRYANQALAQFANGILDIDSDADWNKYVQDLKNMGLETLLTNTQAAYDRMPK